MTRDLLFGTSSLLFLRRLHKQTGYGDWRPDPVNFFEDRDAFGPGKPPKDGSLVHLKWTREDPPGRIEGFSFPAAPAGDHPRRWYPWDRIQELVDERRAGRPRCHFHFGCVDLDFLRLHLLGHQELDDELFLDELTRSYFGHLDRVAGDLVVTLMGIHLTAIDDDALPRFLEAYQVALPRFEGRTAEELIAGCPGLSFDARQLARIGYNRRIAAGAAERGWRYVDINDRVGDGWRVDPSFQNPDGDHEIHLDLAAVLPVWLEVLRLGNEEA